MTNLWAIFLTGLTTGGLSCLAVQGGLLASSIARQVEEDVQRELGDKATALRDSGYETALKALQEENLPRKQYEKKRRKLRHTYPPLAAARSSVGKHHTTRSILLFLITKLVAYTALGFLFGWLGSLLQLTPMMRGGLQLLIGIFMVGTAFRLFNVHPVFRFFVIEPPRFITRYIRRVAKENDGDAATPVFLGALTVLIPCGVTQGMMALAVGSGNPGLGAAIMFSFVLGTSPLFFILSYLASKLGEALHDRFLKFAALAVLILGLVSVEGGLNLVGSPISYAALKNALPSHGGQPTPSGTAIVTTPDRVVSGPMSAANSVTITADGRGYSPRVVKASAGQPLTLVIQSEDLYTCAQTLTISALGVQKVLPANGSTTVELPAQPKGTLAYSCSMGMYRGQIQFD